MDKLKLSLNTEIIQQVVNQNLKNVNDLEHKYLQKRELNLSINSAGIQNSVNQSLKPQSHGAYGSLFEFLDRTDIMNPDNQKIMKNIVKMKQDIQNAYKLDRLHPPQRTESISKKDNMTNKDNSNFMILPSINLSTRTIQHQKHYNHNHNQPPHYTTYDTSFDTKANKSHIIYSTNKDQALYQISPSKLIKNNTQSRVAKYINKIKIMPEKDEPNYLLDLYQKDRQITKKNYLENHELELYEKLAMKSGHHLLRAALQIKQEESDEDQLKVNAYASSFSRVQNGLRILRNKKKTLGMFDKEGNYIKLANRDMEAINGDKTKKLPIKIQNTEIGLLEEDAETTGYTKLDIRDDSKTKNIPKFTYKSKDLKNILIGKEIIKWKRMKNQRSSTVPKNYSDLDDSKLSLTNIYNSDKLPIIRRNNAQQASPKSLSISYDGAIFPYGTQNDSIRSRSNTRNNISMISKKKDREILDSMGLVSPRIMEQVLHDKRKRNISQTVKLIKSSLKNIKRRNQIRDNLI